MPAATLPPTASVPTTPAIFSNSVPVRPGAPTVVALILPLSPTSTSTGTVVVTTKPIWRDTSSNVASIFGWYFSRINL